MCSGAVLYIPSFVKIGPGIQKLLRENTYRHRQQGGLISLLLFFHNKDSRLQLLRHLPALQKYVFITVQFFWNEKILLTILNR
jgi:hypothetical protein